MTFDGCLDFFKKHRGDNFPSDMPYLDVLEIMMGTTYRHLRAKGYPRDMAMRFMLWTLFYFVQKDNILTDEDAEILLTAMRAAQANAYFASGDKCEEDGVTDVTDNNECIQ